MNTPSSALPSALVGIGASAGGLEPIAELISHLPANTGMAFLVVQHLQRSHASMLAGILETKTSMEVAEATDGAAVQADHVYVIPPDTVMRVAQMRIELSPRSGERGPAMPVDDLLASLADDQGAKAIGVILSGSGSDGALGTQRIKEAGGLTFAQDEASAHFNGMPGAAARLGYVDRVLPPKGIAEELARIGRHPYLRAVSSAPESAAGDHGEDDLRPLFVLLRRVTGIDFTHYKVGTLRRRIARRLALHNLATLSDYLVVLEGDSAEAQALCGDLLIRVTSFFRDPRAFEQLTRTVLPSLLEKRPRNGAVRVWVPGCASGEEVYSIAICLLEFLGDRAGSMQIQLFGTDVSVMALRAARAGSYGQNITQDVSEERLQRFFVAANGSYQVSKQLRDLCVFASHDITRDPPFSRIDLLSCRNLLIYFDPVLQKRVIPLFHYALNPGGVLMLGAAESIAHHQQLFSVLDAKHRLYARAPASERTHLPILDSQPAPEQPARVPYDEMLVDPSERSVLLRAVERMVLDRFAPAAVLCDQAFDVVEFMGDTAPYLANPSGPPRLNLTQLARPSLATHLRMAMQEARDTARPVRQADVRVEMNGAVRRIDLEVIPVQGMTGARRWFLVCFEEITRHAAQPAPGLLHRWWARLRDTLRGEMTEPSSVQGIHGTSTEVEYLKRELAATRELMSSITAVEERLRGELKVLQEELLSSNEEFRSTTEELQTAKEELQSSNEELATTNDELRHRNRELSELNAQMTEARDYAEAIVRTISEPLLVLDRNLRVVQANPAYYSTFSATTGLTEAGLLFDIGNGRWNNPELHARLDRMLSEEISFEGLELIGLFGERSNRTFRFNGRRLVWSGHILILLAIEDVTERNATLDALKKQEQRKDEFLAMLAHELRNPLAPMLSAVELWRRGFPDAASEKEAQAILHRQLQQQVHLVNDLLDVSRITSGRIELKRSPVDFGKIVGQAVADLSAVFDGGRQHVMAVLPAEPLLVNGDPTRLAQVVSNLLGNAAKYGKSGGEVNVTLTRQGSTAQLRISDNGIGISPEMLPTIFDLFVQEKRSLARSQGGLGLGLTLVRRLVELHGGTVEAHSPGLSQGSEFIVRLAMLSPADAESLPPQTKPPNPCVTEPRRILVVDDNGDASESIAILLRLDGHDVLTAGDGLAGLQAARTFKPQVALLDIGLPGMDGYEVARRLRDLPETRQALLIAVSGYGAAEDRMRAQQAGFDHHLVKPASVEEIAALIAAHRIPVRDPSLTDTSTSVSGRGEEVSG